MKKLFKGATLCDSVKITNESSVGSLKKKFCIVKIFKLKIK